MRTLRRLLAGTAALTLCAWPGGPALAQSDDAAAEATPEAAVGYAPLPSIDPSLVPDADGFIFEDVVPGVRRLVTDGAGHFPSATYIREARDMDELAVDEEGRVLVWSTTHGVDNELGGDSQLWILGVEGVLDPGVGPPRPSYLAAGWDEPSIQLAPDGSVWSLAWGYGDGGVIRSDGETAERFLANHFLSSLAITPDGRAWVAEGHDEGEAGDIYVIEPGAEGGSVDPAASELPGMTPRHTSGSPLVPVSSVTLGGEPFFVRATDDGDMRRCGGLVVEPATVADGDFLPEAQCWDEGAVWWEDAVAFASSETRASQDRWIELQLGGTYRLDGLIVQADDNDSYLLSYRDPSTDTWAPLWTVPPAYTFGMSTRPVAEDRSMMQRLPAVVADAVRFAARSGDGMYSVSEIQLFGRPAVDLPRAVAGGPAPTWERVLELEDRELSTMLATDAGLWAIEEDRRQPSALWHSIDGAAWTQLDTDALLGEGAVVSEIAEGGPGLLAVGSIPSGATREAVAWTSIDGQEWTVSPLGYTLPAPERPFDVFELMIRAMAAGPDGAVILAVPYTGIDFSLLEPNVAAALPSGLRDYATGYGVMIDPQQVSVSVGPFEVFSEAIRDLDVDQDLFDAYGRAVGRWTEDRLLFVTDDYTTWQQVDGWAFGDGSVSAMTATQDGYLVATSGWGDSAGLYASADGLAWEEIGLPGAPGWVNWFGTDGEQLLMAGRFGGQPGVLGSADDGETWTAWAGLPDGAGDVRVGAFGLLAAGEHESEWSDRSRWAPTVIERDGLTLSIDQGPGGLTLTGPDGETMLTADVFGGDDWPGGLPLPRSIQADHDRAVFTVVDPEGGDPLMEVTYREMQDAFDRAQDPAGLGPDMFIAYSADGSAWSEQSTAGLVGSPSWVSPMAVGDDYAVMMISELDGPSSLWRAIMR